jgi:glyoxylase-like metal-dependent hydrolase (beta-lactamase superfamily II)
MAPGARLANPRTEANARVLDVTTADGLAFTLTIDAATGRPTSVASTTGNPNLGDVVIETSFSDYQDVGGLQLPARLTTRTDRFTTAEVRAAKQTVDAEVGALSAPPAAASAARVAGPPPATVTAEEVAKGIWFLGGQSHHSVLVEFADHLMLIEAPQSEARTLAVIAKARELRPDKPLTKVVNSHHHFDHSAGIRAAVSEGLGVVTHAGNRTFFEEIVKRPHTVVPDALAKKPAPLSIQTVDNELVVEDKVMAVTLYPISGNPHSDTMLMAYFPRERVLVEVDAYSPGSAVQPYAPNLLENITKRKLRVDRIVPLHGTIAPFAELVKSVAATSN